ncbi:F0F1 ATP synthase subunit A [Candidatus Roizmanbacteria bacterium]|nr:F0F1 ATP synthase subunit A [Candidatus Roizmanbacteria bacterium]
MPHISIRAEPLFRLYGFVVTNTLVTSAIFLLLFFGVAIYYYKQAAQNYGKRSRLFYFIHYVNRTLYNFLSPILGSKMRLVFPFLGALFFFILLQNWFGLLPGVGSIVLHIGEGAQKETVPLLRGNTTDLNTTLALGIFAVMTIQYYGVRFLGSGNYLRKFINIGNPLSFFVGILEIVSEFSKVISFSFRLFGNIFAGEVLLTVIAFLIPIAASFPFLILEIFVGFIQALIFTLLTAVFINSAATETH